MNFRPSRILPQRLVAMLALVISGSLPTTAHAASTEAETTQLRARIEQLQDQLRAAQAACPAASSAAPVASVPATAVPSLPAAATATPAPAPPPGYKLVKVDPNELPELPKDDRWRASENWDALRRGMSFAQVDALLGVERRVLSSKGRTQWAYGKIGPNPAGRVVFVDDRLAVWERPEF